MRRIFSLVLLVAACGLVACGDNGNHGATADAAVDGDGNLLVDAPPGTIDSRVIDALIPPNCTPGGTQCTDCIDNDGDGTADGFDVECTGALDNDEGSFATAIPGDNRDPVKQDCFFDGNSGGNYNNDCVSHICCILGLSDADCKTKYDQNFNRATDCKSLTDPASGCGASGCADLAPPGCDCFGCCTICENGTCADILLTPTCTNIADPNTCLRCTKNTQCGGGDCTSGGTDCILCPGEDPANLPASCGGTTTCPNGDTTCQSDSTCGAGKYCSFGCCIDVPG